LHADLPSEPAITRVALKKLREWRESELEGTPMDPVMSWLPT